jgi:DNA replication protein DnaC
MKVNSQNYFEVVNSIGIENLSPGMQKAHTLIDKATHTGSDWKAYTTYKKSFDLQFEALELFLKSKESPKTSQQKETVKRTEYPKAKPYKVVDKPTNKKTKPRQGNSFVKPKVNGRGVELISSEVGFIKRFALLHSKTKTKDQVLSFIRSLQKAIVEKRIRLSSKYAKTIEEIQKKLLAKYKSGSENISFKFSNEDLSRYYKIAGAEIVMPSVRFIKSYIVMQGRQMSKEKAKGLYNRIVDALEKKKLFESDKYFKHIKIILNSLSQFAKQNTAKPRISITEAQLNGLNGVLKECGCHTSQLSRLDEENNEVETIKTEVSNKPPRNTILSSQQVLNLKSDKLNFSGKWLNFIGNPSRGFTAMIYGKPKFGKSYLAMDFAGYLARSHGKVLYVAYEEGFDDTLKQKLQDKNVTHPNLFVSDYLPSNLSAYDFVFIDSVNKATLSPENLDAIERRNPKIGFVYIFQTTKDGNFKGGMEYKHNVDVVIEVPEKGIASQYGRYNQGGDMKIFG